MSISFKIIESSNIHEYQNQFSKLEESIAYPLDGGADSFTINHGEKYNQFFSDMGKARFILAFDSGQLCGSIAGVWKNININNKNFSGLYVGDLKTNPNYRGSKIPSKMIRHALLKYISKKKYRDWDFLYYVGMNGAKGNVTKTFKGFHLGKLSKPVCNQRIYIINSSQFDRLSNYNFKNKNYMTVDLSPNNLNKIITNKGKKDLTLQSSGEMMKLAHIHFQIDRYLNQNLNQILKKITHEFSNYKLCFAIDERNSEFINYLKKNNIESNTTCSIYAFNWPIIGHNLKQHKFISLSTAEI